MKPLTPELRLRLQAFNARLVDVRKAKGLTQINLAKLVGIPTSKISAIETLRTIPSLEIQDEIASALDKSRDYLFPHDLLEAISDGVFDNRVIESDTSSILGIKETLLLPAPFIKQDYEVVRNELSNTISTIMGKRLNHREAYVIRLRFGLDGGGSRSLEEVGKEFNVSRERIRQVEAKALRKLRYPFRRDEEK